MNKAVFLDRDGTIIRDEGYVHKIEDLEFLPGAIEGLKLLSDFKLFIITNQSGIGRGIYSIEQFLEFNNHLVSELDKKGISIEETFFCPHTPKDACDCRKPSTRFIKEAEKRYKIDMSKSYVIGDHPSDIEMGKNAGCRTVYVLTGHGGKHKESLVAQPEILAGDLLEGARLIIKNDK